MNLNIVQAAISTLKFMLLTLPIIVVASYATSSLLKKGLMEKVTAWVKPILRRLNLNEITIASVVMCFVSATAAYSILSQALKERVIDDKEVIAASFINSFPSTLTHFYYFFIPFVIPILGWVGLLYAVLRLIVAAVKSFLGLILAWKWNKRIVTKVYVQPKAREVTTFGILRRVVPVMAITYFLCNIAIQLGVFDVVGKTLSSLPLDSEVISIAAAQLVDIKASIVMCKSLLESGYLSVKWAIAALMFGNVVTFSTSYIKHSLPLHASLFGKLGVKIVVLNGIVSLILDIIVITGVILFL